MLTSPTLYSPAARQPTVEMARDLTSVTQADTPLAPRLRHHPHGGGCAAALGCPLRVLVVSSCQVSAATLIHYCEVFTLWADYAADATESYRRAATCLAPAWAAGTLGGTALRAVGKFALPPVGFVVANAVFLLVFLAAPRAYAVYAETGKLPTDEL